MALSELFHGPGSEGWTAGFTPPPATFTTQQTDVALAAISQFWDKPSTPALDAIQAALDHQQPLVREAAAACLGRIADTGSLRKLAERLGDPSKMVQRAAASAIRDITTRTGNDGGIIRAT